MEIVPGIYLIQYRLRDNAVDHVNTYLLEGDDGWVLIDSGWNDPEAFEEYHSGLKNMGIDFSDIALIIYTHIHPDHYGLAGTLKRRYELTLASHPKGNEYIQRRYFGRGPFISELGEWHIRNGGTEDHDAVVRHSSSIYIDHVEPVFPDRFLRDGDEVSTGRFNLRVVWTPGHDGDHICLYEINRRILFCGDHVLPGTVPHVGIQVEGTGNPVHEYLNSLKAVRDLEVDLVLPGHEHPFENFSERVDNLLSYHNEIESRVLEIVRSGPKTAYEIAAQVPWSPGSTDWHSFPALVQAGLVTKTLAYLESLFQKGMVKKLDKTVPTIYNAT